MNIIHAEYLISSTKWEQCPEPKLPEYAFIGRSNVGKSSLINMLCERKALARTSSHPGKTQAINHFVINNDWYLVDLPGYGYAKTSKTNRRTWLKFIKDYLRYRENLQVVFLLIDSRIDPQKIDLEFAQWMGENSIPFVMVFTKSDKNKGDKTELNVGSFLKKMNEVWEELPDHFVTSALTKTGRENLLSYIHNLNENFYN